GRHTSSKRDWSSDVCSSDLLMLGLTHLLLIFHLALLDHQMLLLLSPYQLLFSLVLHSLRLETLRIIGQYLAHHCYLRHLFLVMLLTRCYIVLFVNLLYPQYRSVHCLSSLELFPSLLLMLGLTHLLQLFHLVLLNRLMLLLLAYCPLLFSLVLHLPLLEMPQTIDLYLTRHYYPHHLLLVMLLK